MNPPGLATPRRPTTSPVTTPAHSPPTLSDTEHLTYVLVPALIEDAEAELAGIILAKCSSEEGCDFLRTRASGRGTAMLALIEARGTPTVTTVDGNILRLSIVYQLDRHTTAGIP